MKLKIGARLRSSVCSTEVIVLRVPIEEPILSCGGVPMITEGDKPPLGAQIQHGFDGGTQQGKRYVLEPQNLEVLCVKSGDGTLSVGDRMLEAKASQPLPSSD